MSGLGINAESMGQNPINARKGITTHSMMHHGLGSISVRILLMPVRALRRVHLSGFRQTLQ